MKTKKLISLLLISGLVGVASLATGCGQESKPNVEGLDNSLWEYDDEDEEWEYDDGRGSHMFFYAGMLYRTSRNGTSFLSKHSKAISGGYAKKSSGFGARGGMGG